MALISELASEKLELSDDADSSGTGEGEESGSDVDTDSSSTQATVDGGAADDAGKKSVDAFQKLFLDSLMQGMRAAMGDQNDQQQVTG